MGMSLPPPCTPRLCQCGAQQDLQRSELPPADPPLEEDEAR